MVLKEFIIQHILFSLTFSSYTGLYSHLPTFRDYVQMLRLDFKDRFYDFWFFKFWKKINLQHKALHGHTCGSLSVHNTNIPIISLSKYIQVYPSISKYIQVYPSILSTSKYLVNLPLKLFFSFLHFKLTDYEYIYYYTVWKRGEVVLPPKSCDRAT